MRCKSLPRCTQYYLSNLIGLNLLLSETSHFRSGSATNTVCESSSDTNVKRAGAGAPTPSWFQKYLSPLRLSTLPLPRRIITGDPVFQNAQMRKGLQQRQKDERRLLALQSDIQKAQKTNDQMALKRIFEKFSEIAYGEGVTAQMREDFLARYGCTGWNQVILDRLIQLGENRGIVEIGAGHGQWARALTEHHDRLIPNNARNFDFVLAYDNMTSLPLSTKMYHEHTQPARDFFFSNVKHCNDVNEVLRQWSCRGRILLMVLPPPGDMAIKCVKAYTEMGPENDTVIYVGEGRGGGTADDAFFDYMESGDWVVLDILEVKISGKGFEKLYIFQRYP